MLHVSSTNCLAWLSHDTCRRKRGLSREGRLSRHRQCRHKGVVSALDATARQRPDATLRITKFSRSRPRAMIEFRLSALAGRALSTEDGLSYVSKGSSSNSEWSQPCHSSNPAPLSWLNGYRSRAVASQQIRNSRRVGPELGWSRRRMDVKLRQDEVDGARNRANYARNINVAHGGAASGRITYTCLHCKQPSSPGTFRTVRRNGRWPASRSAISTTT